MGENDKLNEEQLTKVTGGTDSATKWEWLMNFIDVEGPIDCVEEERKKTREPGKLVWDSAGPVRDIIMDPWGDFSIAVNADAGT